MTLLEKKDDCITNVLFLCPGNDGLSLIAESLLRCAGGGRYWAYSAGSNPSNKADPQAVAVLRDAGLPTGDLRPKDWTLFTRSCAPTMDLIVSLTPFVPYSILSNFTGQPLVASWSVDNPALSRISVEDRKTAFKAILRIIEAHIIRLVNDGKIGSSQFLDTDAADDNCLWREITNKWAA